MLPLIYGDNESRLTANRNKMDVIIHHTNKYEPIVDVNGAQCESRYGTCRSLRCACKWNCCEHNFYESEVDEAMVSDGSEVDEVKVSEPQVDEIDVDDA
ncbi:hypothetical protein Tco_0367143 [Tanacetum coccineum]